MDTRQRFSAVGPPVDQVPLRMGVTITRPDLAAQVNTALSELMDTAAFRDIRTRTLARPDTIFDKPVVAYAIGSIACCLGALVGLMLIRARRKAAVDLLAAAEETAAVERHAANELRAKNEMLVAKNRAMQELIYVVGHDLSSPLVSISGFAHGAKRAQRAGDHEKSLAYLDRVEANVGSMSGLINGILRVSRIGQEVPKPKLVLLSELISDLESRLAGVLERQKAHLVCSGDIELWSDPDMLGRALQNIVENAARHGCLNPGQEIRVIGEQSETGARIRVEDDGPGIPEHLLPRIFEMYQRRADASADSGSGLGLTIVSRLIDKLGGVISVEAEASRGTVFVLELPTAPAENRKVG